jgi:hypothetical protein
MVAYEIIGGLVVLGLILTGIHTILNYFENKGKVRRK